MHLQFQWRLLWLVDLAARHQTEQTPHRATKQNTCAAWTHQILELTATTQGVFCMKGLTISSLIYWAKAFQHPCSLPPQLRWSLTGRRLLCVCVCLQINWLADGCGECYNIPLHPLCGHWSGPSALDYGQREGTPWGSVCCCSAL